MSTMELTKAGKKDIQRKLDDQQEQIDKLMKSFERNSSLMEGMMNEKGILERRVTSLETETKEEKKAHAKTQEKNGILERRVTSLETETKEEKKAHARTQKELQDLQKSIKKQLEEKEEQMKQFLKDKHEEIEAITLKYEAELAGHNRVLQEFVNQNNDLKRTVSYMKKCLEGAAIDGGAAFGIVMIGALCTTPIVSIACGVGALGLVTDCLRRLYNAYSAK